ncbi:polysaccharide deacetylase family protein [Clostridium sp. HBUAS56017]|uniref:polysaccharide deacetylase family protein n=1 Tax=Clostridium sp. HBUAS56017 TaxID=2571128 RepID=UPI0011774F83|nr:polysaccharide deacetylase family protein [Clostridium sp. HBUAS56017]
MGKHRRRKSSVQQKRNRREETKKKKVVLFIVIIVAIVGGGFLAKIKFEGDKDKIYTKAEIVESSETSNESKVEEPILDNTGYTALEKDPNADDAISLEKIVRPKSFPVRTDGKKVVYLTFDDGPSTTNTPKILDILKENNIKASFMIMGKNAEKSEESKEILRRTVKEGHAIGNHTYGHDYNYLYPYSGKVRVLNVNNFMGDVDKCNQTLKSILGKDFSTRVIRFPGGFTSWRGTDKIKPIMEQKGYASIDWNAETKDSEGKPKNADELFQVCKKDLQILGPNADSVIILMHDTYGKGETVNALQRIIDMFKEKGFEFRTMK